MIQVSVDTWINPVVVLGANAEELTKDMAETGAHTIINHGWKQGMASSIVCGLNAMTEKYPLATAVIIMMCDQPFVSASLLGHLISTHQHRGKVIVTCRYDNDTMGPPVLFHQSLFPELLQLQGDSGARLVVQKHINELATVAFPGGNIDIDTIEDYEALSQKLN